MGRVSLGTARIVVIVALVVGGVALLANGFDDASSVAAPVGSPTATASPTAPATTGASSQPSAPPSTPAAQAPAKVVTAVFNGTTALGLAAQAQDTLTGAGYKIGQPAANSPVPGVSKTIAYYRTGPAGEQNRANAQALVDQYFKGAKVEALGPDYATAVDKTVQVVVVLGEDYATAHPA